MGLDYIVKFKQEITYNNETSDEFSPYGRGLSQFIGNHLNGSESLLLKVEEATGVKLEYITEPNLYDFQVNELQLEYAKEEEKQRLIELQKQLDAESNIAWHAINEFAFKLSETITALTGPTEPGRIEYDRKWWSNYLENGEFIGDLNELFKLLSSAMKQKQEYFTYIIN